MSTSPTTQMIVIREPLGVVGEKRYAARRIERLPVRWSEAPRSRLRRTTDAGTDIAIDVPRDTYLAEGLVLADDGQRIVVVERLQEPGLRITIDPDLSVNEFVRHVALIAHAFGNQHAPLEVLDGEIRLPITTSERVARETVSRLDLPGATISVEFLRLGRHHPMALGDQHG
jgi:urease accessory protein